MGLGVGDAYLCGRVFGCSERTDSFRKVACFRDMIFIAYGGFFSGNGILDILKSGCFC